MMKKEKPSPGDDCWALGLVATEVVTGRVISFRMGRCDLPIHMAHHFLAEAISESIAVGGPTVGAICGKLLAMNVAQRATTTDVVQMLGGAQISQHSSLKTPSTPREKPALDVRRNGMASITVPTVGQIPMRDVAAPRVLATPLRRTRSAELLPQLAQPGQTMTYAAPAQVGGHTLVPGLPGRNSSGVQFTATGAQKVGPDPSRATLGAGRITSPAPTTCVSRFSSVGGAGSADVRVGWSQKAGYLQLVARPQCHAVGMQMSPPTRTSTRWWRD